MRQRSFILPAFLLALLALAGGGLFLYDQRAASRVGQRVTIGGVAVGGLTAAQARTKLERSLRAGLREPIVVRGEGRTFRLTPHAAGATYDFDGMVDSAITASRAGNIFTRTYRNVRGQPLNLTLPADLRYSRLVVTRFVRRVDNAVSRQPVDAHLEFAGGYPTRVAGKDGLHVSFPGLRRQITDALTGSSPSRTVYVQGERVKPKVVKAQLAGAYPRLIVVDRSSFTLRYFRNLKLAKTYTIAIGAVGFDTPVGMYHVQNKAIDPAWTVPNKPWAGKLAGQVIPGGTAQNPLKARWMGIYDGAGIHGTDQTGSLGSAASHGCIRMAVPDVVELYERVPVQTPVYIA